MIKLIATDVDGTLVKDSSSEIYEEIFEVIKSLRNKEIIIAIASGRQYNSLYKMFEPIAKELIFIAENGAHIKCREQNISVISMNPEDAREIIQDLRMVSGGEIVVSTPDGSYIESKNRDFIDLITYAYRNKVTIVNDLLSEKLDIIKIAVYKKGTIREEGEKLLVPKWSDRCKACMSGEEWVDFMDSSVDKGNALKTIQDFFHISPEETMTFGDNANDIGMLLASGESYAVETARKEVKAHANFVCGSYGDRGVLGVLKQLNKSM